MPQVRFSQKALRDLERLRDFLRPKNPLAAKKASTAIKKSIRTLEEHPSIGRSVEGMESAYRELLIGFGDSGYVVRYFYEGDDVIVLALKHQKETGS